MGSSTDPDERKLLISQLYVLSSRINDVRAKLSEVRTVHRRSPIKQQRTPWNLVADEIEALSPDERRPLRPALRALANYRDISRESADIEFTMRTATLATDEIKSIAAVALNMTMESMYHYWVDPNEFIFDDTLKISHRRSMAIRAVRRAMNEVCRDCGAHLLEAGAKFLLLANTLMTGCGLPIVSAALGRPQEENKRRLIREALESGISATKGIQGFVQSSLRTADRVSPKMISAVKKEMTERGPKE